MRTEVCPAGTVAIGGTDFVTIDADGKLVTIVTIVGFFGDPWLRDLILTTW